MEKNVRHLGYKEDSNTFYKKKIVTLKTSAIMMKKFLLPNLKDRIMEDIFDIWIKSYFHLSFDCNPNY